MAQDTLTTYDALLKNFYGVDRAIDAVKSRAKLFASIKDGQVKQVNEVRGKGLQMRIPVITSANCGFGIVAEGGTIPTPQALGSDELVWPTYKWVGQVRFTVESDIASMSSEYAFGRVMDTQFSYMEDSMGWRTNTMMMVDGTGYLGSASLAGVATVTLTIDDGTLARLFRAGLFIDSWTAKSGGAKQVDGAEVLYVDYDTGVVTLAAADDWDAGSFFFIKGSARAEVMGVEGIADDGTVVTTIAGVTRSSNPWAQGRVYDANTAPLSENLIQTILDQIELGEYGTGGLGEEGNTVILLCDPQTRRWLAQLLQTYIRNNNPGELKGGAKSFTYDFFGKTVKLIADYHCLPNNIFILNPKGLLWGWAKKPGWWDAGGSIVSKDYVGNTMSLIATYYYIGNFCATHFPTQGVLTDYDAPA